MAHAATFIALLYGMNWRMVNSESMASGATIAGGLFHTCIIRQDFSLVCFGGGSSDLVETLAPTGSVEDGFGFYGQIGSGDNETLGDEGGEMGSNLAPVNLANESAQAIAAGQSHTCIMVASGKVACWGYNDEGQLGVGDTSSRGTVPSDMGDGLDFVDLGVGRSATNVGCGQHHSCAVLDDGSLKCWGWNSKGTLGLGDTGSRGRTSNSMGDNLAAVDLGQGRTATYVDGGRYHTCALLDNEAVKCWGGGNSSDHNHGQLGQGNTFDIGTSPGQMGDALPEIDFGAKRTVKALATGWFHTCVILDDQTVRCFGRNFDGQLGLGDQEDRGDKEGEMGDNLPAVDLGSGKLAVAITCGRWHTCVLLDDDTIKCFGVNTSDDLGAGQLGLEDTMSRGGTVASMGDGLETVDLGISRVPVWVRAAFDHTCAIFVDSTVKCWGLNTSGQLGIGDTDDRGDEEGSMGSSLPVADPGDRLAWPASVFDLWDVGDPDEQEGLSEMMIIVVTLVALLGVVVVLGVILIAMRVCRHHKSKHQVADSQQGHGDHLAGSSPLGTHGKVSWIESSPGRAPGTVVLRAKNQVENEIAHSKTPYYRKGSGESIGSSRLEFTGTVAATAAAGTAGVVIAGGMAAGWNVLGLIAENLPWVGVAYHLLNELADMVDTKYGMEGNMEKIKRWALSLREVLFLMAKQISENPSVTSKALQAMSEEVVSNLQELVDAVASYNQKGALAQYVASRSCQAAVDAADTQLRGALTKLSVGQGVEVMRKVSQLERATLVVDEKLDMIIEHIKKQEAHAARIELRLAEYSDYITEVLGQFIAAKSRQQSSQPPPNTKTLRELGKAQLEKLQISKDSITFPTNRPFAAGAHSQVYQVVHEGVVKAAKVVNLTRLGLSERDVDRVFGRFVKELYILSQMHSTRVVSVYGAIASSSELTLIMEYAERGSLRTGLKHITKFASGATRDGYVQMIRRQPLVVNIPLDLRPEVLRLYSLHDSMHSSSTILHLPLYPGKRSRPTLFLDVVRDEDERHKMRGMVGVLHRLMADVAEGMAYIYKAGVNHRDLKSDNCLVTHDWRAKITDFGLSKTTDAISSASTSTVSPFRGGTLVYAAPELLPGCKFSNEEVPAELSDVFSYGVILWEAVVSEGELPWDGMSTESVLFALHSGKRLEIPQDCARLYRTLMTECWRRDPSHRPNFERLSELLATGGGTGIVAGTAPFPARDVVNTTRQTAVDRKSCFASSRQRSFSDSLVGSLHDEAIIKVVCGTKGPSGDQEGCHGATDFSRHMEDYKEQPPSVADSRSSYWDTDIEDRGVESAPDRLRSAFLGSPGSVAYSDNPEQTKKLIRLRSAASFGYGLNERSASHRSLVTRGTSGSSSMDSTPQVADVKRSATTSLSLGGNVASIRTPQSSTNRLSIDSATLDLERQDIMPPSYWDILERHPSLRAPRQSFHYIETASGQSVFHSAPGLSSSTDERLRSNRWGHEGGVAPREPTTPSEATHVDEVGAIPRTAGVDECAPPYEAAVGRKGSCGIMGSYNIGALLPGLRKHASEDTASKRVIPQVRSQTLQNWRHKSDKDGAEQKRNERAKRPAGRRNADEAGTE